jgi:PAS domain S-box-containing protein
VRVANERTASAAAAVDFETLFALSPNPYVLLNPALEMVRMNEAYLRVTMRTREELLGRNLFDAFPSEPGSDSYRLLHGSFERVLSTGESDEIALIRYDIPRPDGGMDVRYWSATHTPQLDPEGEVEFILQHTVDVTELEGLRRLRDEMGLVERASAVQARNLSLSEEAQRLRTLFEQAPGFVAILGGPDHRFVLANEAYRELVGQRDLIGRTVAEALPEVVGQGFLDLLDQVLTTRTAYVGNRIRVYLSSGRAGESGGDRYLTFVYQPIFDANGSVTGVFVQGHDVTQEVEAEERLNLLINELNHRVKNTLSIVQGLAMQSFRRLEGSEAARLTFDSRLNALAAAHGLLTERNWEAAALAEVVRGSLVAAAGQAAERAHLEGPELTLTPQAAVSLAMMVHELSTNAIKYGALSVESGRVDVGWIVTHDEDEILLEFEWRESGGPPVVAPERRGFGTRLIERGLSASLKGTVAIEYLPEGLRCTMRVRLPAVVA